MPLSYRLVQRPDMRKDAAVGAKLFYAQVKALKKVSFDKLCDMIAVRSTAFVGDVRLIIDGMISVMQERLEDGDIIQMGRLGNFRMLAGSKGVATKAEFGVDKFNKARIVFTPGVILTAIKNKPKFEKMDEPEEKTEKPVNPDENPDIL